ncbi:MAG: four helix bundle protein [Bacteroidetes bacterium]|nr:four helix bundle protein [Bacteroidota bacterium]
MSATDLSILKEEAARYGLNQRIKRFILEVWDFCDQLPGSPSGRNVANQLTRSSSSVGANFRAAFRGRSVKEYIAKLGIAEEEADESSFWLDISAARKQWSNLEALALELQSEADQLTAIIVSLIKKAKKKL